MASVSPLCLNQERQRALAERSRAKSLQHSLEEEQRAVTQQLSVERVELERAKVRWGGDLQVLFTCPVSVSGAALRCVVEERAGCWAAASFLCLLSATPSCAVNRPQTKPLAHGCERLLCACTVLQLLGEPGARAFRAGFPPGAGGLKQPLGVGRGSVAEMGFPCAHPRSGQR